MSNKFVWCVIPAFNEETQILSALSSIYALVREGRVNRVVVVDDGSMDTTPSQVQDYIRSNNFQGTATLLCHTVNLGVGAALKTAFAYIASQYTKPQQEREGVLVATYDADGQHSPEDLQKIVEKQAETKADIVVGVRKMTVITAPFSRIITNLAADLLTSVLAARLCVGSQSGLRCFSLKALSSLNLKARGYATCSETLINASRRGLKIVSVEIRTIYTKDSLIKGQPISNAINVLKELLSII